MEDVDAERGGFGGFVENGSPRTPSALGSARGVRGAIGSNGSFGSVRGAKREPDGVGEDKPIFSLETLETVSAGGSREKAPSPSFPLDSPFHKPGKEKRAKRETASPLGFPDLDNEGGGASGEVQTRGGVSNAGFKKKPALGKEKKEPTETFGGDQREPAEKPTEAVTGRVNARTRVFPVFPASFVTSRDSVPRRAHKKPRTLSSALLDGRRRPREAFISFRL